MSGHARDANMGKAHKARAPRSMPYARPETTMDTEEDVAPQMDKKGRPLSAHKLKVIERKRLQAQIAEVATQRRKIKAGDKNQKKVVKAAKKQLSKQIQQSKQQRATLQSFVEAERARHGGADAAKTPPATLGGFQFNLPARPVAMDAEFLPAR